MGWGILHAPDYGINVGGIIDIHYNGPGYDTKVVRAHLERIGSTLSEIFSFARRQGRSTDAVANSIAEARFRGNAG